MAAPRWNTIFTERSLFNPFPPGGGSAPRPTPRPRCSGTMGFTACVFTSNGAGRSCIRCGAPQPARSQ